MLISEFEQETEESKLVALKYCKVVSAFRKRHQNHVKKLYDLLPYNSSPLNSWKK